MCKQKIGRKKLAKALEERYGEEFIVLDSIVTSANWLNAGPLTAVCYPKYNKNLFFKADYSISNHYLYEDEYIEAIVREEAYAEMEEILSEYYTDFFLDVDIYAKDTNQKIFDKSDVSISKYEEIYGEKMILSFDIVFNNDEIDDYEEVSEIFKQYSEKFTNGKVNYFCYYMDLEAINECKKLEENDYWENFYVYSQRDDWGNDIQYAYRFRENKFYLSSIINSDGVKRFNNDGTPIIENEE